MNNQDKIEIVVRLIIAVIGLVLSLGLTYWIANSDLPFWLKLWCLM